MRKRGQVNLFQFPLEDAVPGEGCEQGLSSVTTEGDEVEVARILIANQTCGRDGQMLHLVR